MFGSVLVYGTPRDARSCPTAASDVSTAIGSVPTVGSFTVVSDTGAITRAAPNDGSRRLKCDARWTRVVRVEVAVSSVQRVVVGRVIPKVKATNFFAPSW